MSDSRKVVLWQKGGSDLAYRCCTMPPDDHDGKIVWVPRSVVNHVSWPAPADEDGWRKGIFDVQEWFANKENL